LNGVREFRLRHTVSVSDGHYTLKQMNSVDLLSNVTHLTYVMTYNSTENGNILTKLESQPLK